MGFMIFKGLFGPWSFQESKRLEEEQKRKKYQKAKRRGDLEELRQNGEQLGNEYVLRRCPCRPEGFPRAASLDSTRSQVMSLVLSKTEQANQSQYLFPSCPNSCTPYTLEYVSRSPMMSFFQASREHTIWRNAAQAVARIVKNQLLSIDRTLIMDNCTQRMPSFKHKIICFSLPFTFFCLKLLATHMKHVRRSPNT